MTTWDPSQYERFRDERSKPFFDLLAMVRPEGAMRVVDLGCGTGALTRDMHARLGARSTVGVDSSREMLARAPSAEGLRFELGDVADFAAASPEGELDLVFSNAALHWLPDHPALFAKLARMLAPGGQLAVQMPANFDHPAHVVAAEVASEAPFRDVLAGETRARAGVLLPEAYAEIVHGLGCREQDVHLSVYGHVLASRDDVIEWVKGSLLTDYQRRMPPETFALYMDRYRERLLPRLSDARPFFYPFKRILIWASR
jgi:trans-aconitate 2-methyltransferase